MFDARDSPKSSPAPAVALACLEADIRAGRPEAAPLEALDLDRPPLTVAAQLLDLTEFDLALVLGGGKAAAGVVRGLDGVLGEQLDDGLVVVPADSPATGTRIGPSRLRPAGIPSRRRTAPRRLGGCWPLLSAPTNGRSFSPW